VAAERKIKVFRVTGDSGDAVVEGELEKKVNSWRELMRTGNNRFQEHSMHQSEATAMATHPDKNGELILVHWSSVTITIDYTEVKPDQDLK
jgi:hypothetical protein